MINSFNLTRYFQNHCHKISGKVPSKKVLFSQARQLSLSYKIVDGPSFDPPLLMAHGMMGNKSNFNHVAKKLNIETGRKIITYDARNHGNSAHHDKHSLKDMCDDVLELLASLEVKTCVFIGHSMGGRVAIYTALTHPDCIDKLIVVDSSPVVFRSNRVVGSTLSYVKAMQHVTWKEGVASLSDARRIADVQLQEEIADDMIRSFLLTNVCEFESGKFGWRVNLSALRDHLETAHEFTYDETTIKPFEKPSFFLGGGNSDFIQTSDYPAIMRLFPNAIISHMPDCGHWVHSEKPKEFVENCVSFLQTKETLLF